MRRTLAIRFGNIHSPVLVAPLREPRPGSAGSVEYLNLIKMHPFVYVLLLGDSEQRDTKVFIPQNHPVQQHLHTDLQTA